jgi:CO/xanthine dehydrogenase Mo-binding subunit
VTTSFLASRTRAAADGIGKPLRRKEDRRLITGDGRYTDDVARPGQVHACMVRSPYAHAAILGIDPGDALKTPGVIAVLTGVDVAGDGVGLIPHPAVPSNPHEVPLKSRDGSPFFVAPHAPLPTDRARFVGEPVAMVIAETPAAARDSAERVRVEWRPLSAVIATAEAVGGPAVWDERASNLCVDSTAGDAAATEAAFARGGTGSPACRWSRAPSSASTTRPAAATRSTPARADRGASRTTWPARSGCRRPRSASLRATSAATTVRATAAIPNSRWWHGRPGGWAAP